MDNLQARMTSLDGELDQKVMRPMSKAMFTCSASCCDEPRASQKDFARCTERCSEKIQQVQATIQVELEQFSSRVQRCLAACQDKAQTRVSDVGVDKARAEMDKCANECGHYYVKDLDKLRPKLVGLKE